MKTKFDIRPSSRVIKQIWSFNENVQTCWETYEVQMCSEFQENSLCLCKLKYNLTNQSRNLILIFNRLYFLGEDSASLASSGLLA